MLCVVLDIQSQKYDSDDSCQRSQHARTYNTAAQYPISDYSFAIPTYQPTSYVVGETVQAIDKHECTEMIQMQVIQLPLLTSVKFRGWQSPGTVHEQDVKYASVNEV